MSVELARSATPPFITQAYCDGALVAESFAVEEVPKLAAAQGTVVWVHLRLPSGASALHQLGADFGFSDIVIEDALSRHERPKVVHHDGYLFANAYATTCHPTTGAIVAEEVSAIMMPTVLVTLQSGAGAVGEELTARLREEPERLRHGPAALLYTLLDIIVDGHFATVQALDDEVEAIEEMLFEEGRQHSVQKRTYQLRKGVVHLRRVVLPMREVVSALLRLDTVVVDADLRPYYQDLYDHALRVAEWSESLRDMVTAIFETNLSLQDHRLNMVIKKLTSWAAIIAVPTAITGFFGQNVTFPGEGSWSGMFFSLILMAGTAGALYWLFRKREWL